MKTIICYNEVLQALLAQGLRSLYFNSGSFGFSAEAPPRVSGWIGPLDPTIRAEARRYVRQAGEPYVGTLAAGALRVWREALSGVVWVMPASHWAYELDYGSREWLPEALRSIGIDPDGLAHLTNAAAIAFEQSDEKEFDSFLHQLLDNLSGSSDFQLAWPGRPVLCTVHHHKQLWWTTTDPELFRTIESSLG